MTVDVIVRAETHYPGATATATCHAATDANRCGRARYRSIVGISCSVLEHATTVEGRGCGISKRCPYLIPWKIPSEAKPSDDLTKGFSIQGIKDCYTHVFKEPPGISMLVPIRSASKLTSRELSARCCTIFVTRNENHVRRPSTRLVVSSMDAMSGRPNGVVTD